MNQLVSGVMTIGNNLLQYNGESGKLYTGAYKTPSRRLNSGG